MHTGPDDLPIAVPIDIEKDLGFGDKLVAFRANFGYRFSKRHGIAIGYYRLQFDGSRRLPRTIKLGDSDFELGLRIDSKYDETIFKVAYNFIFHDEGRVALSVSPGLHISSVDFAIGATLELNQDIGISLPPLGLSEDASVTAPLPMLGGRMEFRMTPKWSMIMATDVFFLTSDGQQGAVTDSSILFEYQGDSAFGFGGGINRFSVDLDIVKDGIRWDWQTAYSGAFLYMKYHF
jgi:hypothetical protein